MKPGNRSRDRQQFSQRGRTFTCRWLALAALAAGSLAARGQTVPPAAAEARASHRVPPATNVVSYWYGAGYRTPFVLKPQSGQAAEIARHAMEYTHADFWRLGSNFADVMVSQSNMAEPASNGGTGATEIYAILRSKIGLNEAVGTQAFHRGPVRDVAVEVGANLETKNSAYGPAERTIYFGPNVQLAVPRGYVNVGLHLRKEWNHEAVLSREDDYAPDINIEPTWLLPFSAGKVHLAYAGFAEYNTAKGKDSFGSETAPEFLIRHYVSVDAGALLLHRAELVELNGGFWYWHNEYGKPAADPGATQMTPIFGLAIHLDGGRALRSE